ncbi:putative IPT1 Mannosyl diphosphorylinositol ceramide synthase protein [Rutstroemia sp. NJR-2017a BVV2]|nr:putative IPT1 Mannosyl diphosphorylinositol ceramide synthase protein [Rutstroemia sp. NJR-2017a BVV2]
MEGQNNLHNVFFRTTAWRISPSIRPAIDVNYLENLDKEVFGLSFSGLAIQFTCSVIGVLWMNALTRRTKLSLLAALPPLLLNILYSLSHNLCEALDVFTWLSYGVIHFISPFLAAFWLWLFAPPGVVSVFAWSFGIQNCLGIITHLSFPSAAPWYGDQYGYPLPPGTYSMPGSAAGLVRVDKVLGTHIYANAFKASPLVFGAFPSLHGAFSCCCFFFIGRYSRKGAFLLGFYVLWQWFSTMYLRHHWRLDLLGGLAYSAFAFSLFYRGLQKIDRAYATGVSGGNGWQRLWEGTRLQYWFDGKPDQRGYEMVLEEHAGERGRKRGDADADKEFAMEERSFSSMESQLENEWVRDEGVTWTVKDPTARV